MECPICQKIIKENIEVHVNHCLDESQVEQSRSQSTSPTPQNKLEIKIPTSGKYGLPETENVFMKINDIQKVVQNRSFSQSPMVQPHQQPQPQQSQQPQQPQSQYGNNSNVNSNNGTPTFNEHGTNGNGHIQARDILHQRKLSNSSSSATASPTYKSKYSHYINEDEAQKKILLLNIFHLCMLAEMIVAKDQLRYLILLLGNLVTN